MSKDRPQRAGGKIAATVDRHDHQSGSVGPPQVVMGATNVDFIEARSPKGAEQGPSADPRELLAQTATSTSTTSEDVSPLGTGTPAVAAASR